MLKRVRDLSPANFLKLLFAFFSVAFLVAAMIMPDRSSMFSGLWQILSQPSKVSTNYFAVGGYAATFLNMGLVCLICTALYCLPGAVANNVSTLAFLLTAGFCSWGINLLNIWPTFLGVVLYCLVKREKVADQVNAMLFSTGIAPLITDLLIRYPNTEVVGFTWQGVLLALGVGLVIGFFLPAGLAHSPKVHKGFDLYSAAVPVGMTAFFLQAILFKTMGVELPAAPAAETLQVASWTITNVFCFVVFGLCVVFALLMGCKPGAYWNLLKDPAHGVDFSKKYGKAAMLMNVGLYGLFIVLYYNLYVGLLQFRQQPQNRVAHHGGLCGGLLSHGLALRCGRRNLCPGHQRPSHCGGPLLCQWSVSHHREIRLALWNPGRYAPLLPGDQRTAASRRLLPIQRRLYGSLRLPGAGAPAGAVLQNPGRTPGCPRTVTLPVYYKRPGPMRVGSFVTWLTDWNTLCLLSMQMDAVPNTSFQGFFHRQPDFAIVVLRIRLRWCIHLNVIVSRQTVRFAVGQPLRPYPGVYLLQCFGKCTPAGKYRPGRSRNYFGRATSGNLLPGNVVVCDPV